MDNAIENLVGAIRKKLSESTFDQKYKIEAIRLGLPVEPVQPVELEGGDDVAS